MTFLGDLMLYPELTTSGCGSVGKSIKFRDRSQSFIPSIPLPQHMITQIDAPTLVITCNNQYICPHPSGLVSSLDKTICDDSPLHVPQTLSWQQKPYRFWPSLFTSDYTLILSNIVPGHTMGFSNPPDFAIAIPSVLRSSPTLFPSIRLPILFGYSYSHPSRPTSNLSSKKPCLTPLIHYKSVFYCTSLCNFSVCCDCELLESKDCVLFIYSSWHEAQ